MTAGTTQTQMCRNCGQAEVLTGIAAGECTPEHPDGYHELADDGLCETCWDEAEDARSREMANRARREEMAAFRAEYPDWREIRDCDPGEYRSLLKDWRGE